MSARDSQPLGMDGEDGWTMIGKFIGDRAEAASGHQIKRSEPADADNFRPPGLAGDDLEAGRRLPAAPKCGRKLVEADAMSVTSTSDVNSYDNALSIASGLSQIVAEEEARLGSTGKSSLAQDEAEQEEEAGRAGARRSPGRRSGGHLELVHSSSSELGRPRGPPGPAGLNRCRRASLQPPRSEPCSVGRPVANVEPPPVITMTASAECGEHSHSAAMARTKSACGRRKSISPTRRCRRGSAGRSDSAGGFLPERGDLRQLESSRQQLQAQPATDLDPAGQRARSNTAGSASTGHLMLNIRRSAWTLSEFDQTFNKDELAAETVGGLVDPPPSAHPSRPSPPSTPAPVPPIRNHRASAHRLGSASNLLIRASRNAISLQQSNGSQPGGPRDHSNGTPLGPAQAQTGLSSSRRSSESCLAPSGRRPSRTHSIVSLASSVDSLGVGMGSILKKKNNNKKKKKKATRKRVAATGGGSSADDDDDDDENGYCPRPSFCNMATLAQFIPVLDWLPRYQLSYLWGDLVAGLAVAVLNISTSLSAAVVAETDLGAAFRSSIVNTLVYSLLCTSRHTSFGSWSIMSQMLLISVRRALSDELILNRINLGPSASWRAEEYEMWHMNIIIMYTFLIGLVQLVSGLLNLGSIMAAFIPEALCSSMIAATAFTMAVGQLANMCGTSNKILWAIEKNTTELWADLKNPPVDITDLFAGLFRWIQQIALLAKYYEQINIICVIISIISVILLSLNQYVIQVHLKRLLNRNIFLPFELILLIMMILISYALDLSETYQVATCGPIHIDFVMPSVPNLRLFRELWFDSLATALISFTMVFIMAKTYSNKLNYEIDCNQELIACGAGNLIGGLCDALPATASFSRTAGQVEAGGSTQMASIINCLVLIVLAQLLGHHVSALPICVMSATLFFGFVRMMSRSSEALTYWRICKVDFAIWIVTFCSILVLDMVNGFLYGLMFSILTMLYRAQNRRCYLLGSIGTGLDVYVPLAKYPSAREIEGIKIFQFCGPIHYVCADLFERLLRQKTRVDVKQILIDTEEEGKQRPGSNPNEPPFSQKGQPTACNLPTHIVLDFSMISFIDSAGINVIKKIIEDYQRVQVTILLASLASHVASVVKSEPTLWEVHKERFYVTLADAVYCAMRDARKRRHSPVACCFVSSNPTAGRLDQAPPTNRPIFEC